MKISLSAPCFLAIAAASLLPGCRSPSAGSARAPDDLESSERWARLDASVLPGDIEASWSASTKKLTVAVWGGVAKVSSRASDKTLLLNNQPFVPEGTTKAVKTSDVKVLEFVDGFPDEDGNLAEGVSSTVMLDLAVGGAPVVELNLGGGTDAFLARGTTGPDKWSMKPAGELLLGRTIVTRRSGDGPMFVDLLLGAGADGWDGSKFLGGETMSGGVAAWNTMATSCVDDGTGVPCQDGTGGVLSGMFVVEGGSGADTFVGGGLSEVLRGGEDDDTFGATGGGRDVVWGGPGSDLFKPTTFGLVGVSARRPTIATAYVSDPEVDAPDIYIPGAGLDTLDLSGSLLADGFKLGVMGEDETFGYDTLHHVDLVSLTDRTNALPYAAPAGLSSEDTSAFDDRLDYQTSIGVIAPVGSLSGWDEGGEPAAYWLQSFERVVSPEARVRWAGPQRSSTVFIEAKKKFGDYLSGAAAVSYEKRTAAVTVDLSARPLDGSFFAVGADGDPSGGAEGAPKVCQLAHDLRCDASSDCVGAGVGGMCVANAFTSGESGEGDVLWNVRGAVGGTGADVLTGPCRRPGGFSGERACQIQLPDAEMDQAWSVRLEGGKGNDALWGSPFPNLLLGGDGNDTLDGGDDNDILDAGEGADTLVGYDGDDLLNGGRGADRMDGGEGFDVVTYADRKASLTLNLSLQVSDEGFTPAQLTRAGVQGEAREGDAFLDIEGAIGGSADDSLTALPAVDTGTGLEPRPCLLFGAGGDDTLTTPDANSLAVAMGGSGSDLFTMRGGFLWMDKVTVIQLLEDGRTEVFGARWSSAERFVLGDLGFATADSGFQSDRHIPGMEAAYALDTGADGDDVATAPPCEEGVDCSSQVSVRSCGGGLDFVLSGASFSSPSDGYSTYEDCWDFDRGGGF
ncbi:MAG: hypothetical protein RL199_119 [Pseudomonadota bacterium]|jgi:Ca2+-binding RTX toxin-like protein